MIAVWYGITAEDQFTFWLMLGFFTFLVMAVVCGWTFGPWINAQLSSARKQLPRKKFKGESFRYSFFLVVLGFFGRWLASGSGDGLAERMANLEWATNTQNTLCFTAVVCALNVLYNQQKRRGDAA